MSRADAGPGGRLDTVASDDVAVPRTRLLAAGRPVARALTRLRFDVRVHHADRVPATGPVLLASNHIAIVDGPLLAFYAPRPVHALTKIEMFRGRLGGFLLAAGQLPLERYTVDPYAVKLAVRTLRAGACVAIYPEGARCGGDLQRFNHGAAYLALVTGTPVVPVTMVGSRLEGAESGQLPPWRARIDIGFGHPVAFDPVGWPRTQHAVRETSAELRAAMLRDQAEFLAEVGRRLPGPLPSVAREVAQREAGEQDRAGRSTDRSDRSERSA